MDQFNFLKMLDGLVTGDGFRRDLGIPLGDIFLFSDGSRLTTTTTTNAGFAMAETNALMVTWAATKVVAVGLNFHIPGDYDQSKDEVTLYLDVQMGGATDTPTFTGNIYRKRSGSAISADLGPVSSGTMGSTSSRVSLALTTLALQGGDNITVKLTPAAHGTDAIRLLGVYVRYRGDLVLFTESSR